MRDRQLRPVCAREPGRVSAGHRQFFDTELWIARTGVLRRDLPERFGHCNSSWRRFDRWAQKGIWIAVFEVLQDPDVEG